jgi:two-component sensor histidine kinase
MLDADERPSGVVVVASNIARQKESEQRLRESLREKEVLLKEVHHRVKNNLQVISSLLNLQASELHDPAMIRVLRDSQTRVRSMALIHEQLYRSDDLAHIDFADYTNELVDHLNRTLGSRSERIQLSLDIRPLRLSLDLAIPCGMIVNELVCNALEHAFPENLSGEIRVTFRRDDDTYRLTVADTGVGMRGSLSSKQATTMGLKVVQALTRQIHGQLEHECQGGSVFTVSFPYAEGLVGKP